MTRNAMPCIVAEELLQIFQRTAEIFLESLLSIFCGGRGRGLLLNRDQAIPCFSIIGRKARELTKGLFRRRVHAEQLRCVSPFMIDDSDELDVFGGNGSCFHRGDAYSWDKIGRVAARRVAYFNARTEKPRSLQHSSERLPSSVVSITTSRPHRRCK